MAFLEGLAAHNTREWFEAHKADYEAHFKGPAPVFAEALAAELQERLDQPMSAKVFRIHRDVRFSKDKTPYNAWLRVAVRPERGGGEPPLWMLGLQPDGLTVGVGVFEGSGPALDAFRARLDGPDGEDLAKLVARLEADGVRFNAPDLKRVPAPYPQDHPRGELLRRKGLTAWRDGLDPALAFGAEGPAKCAEALMPLKPVADWLMDA